jgi:hypothetical protein
LELQNLTSIEHALLALSRVKCNIYKLNTHSSGTVLKFRGNIITFPQNPVQLLDILPNIPSSETIQILFIGKSQPTMVDLKKLFNVRRQKIEHALKWLIANNHLYAHCKISRDNLLSLPEDDVPNFVLNNIERVLSDDLNFQEPKGYCDINANSSEILNNDPGDSIELDSMALIETNDAINLELLDKLVLLKQKMKNGDKQKHIFKNIITIPHGEKPLNEINNPTLILSSYPHLFPYGIGGFNNPNRKKKLSIREHLKYLLEQDDLKFAQDKTFQCVIFNQIQRAEARQRVFLMLKKKNFSTFVNEFKQLTIEDVEKTAKNYSVTNKLDPNSTFAKLFNKVHSVSVQVQGSKASLYNRRMDLKSYLIKFGLPLFYITINPADVHNPLILMIANDEINLDSCSISKSFNRMNIVKKNPYAQAKFFDIIISTLLKEVICFSHENKKEGVLGIVDAYYCVVEANDRGALHGHFEFWVKTNLTPVEMKVKLKNDTFRQHLCCWVDSLIKCDLEDYNVREIAPSTVHPCCRSLNLNKNINTMQMEKNFKVAVYEIVQKSNVHKCSFTCKSKFHDNCRFGFPKNLIEQTLINEETGKVEIKRNNPNLNNFMGKLVFSNLALIIYSIFDLEIPFKL